MGKATRLSGIRIASINVVGAGAGMAGKYKFTLVAEICKSDMALAAKNLSISLKEILQTSVVRKD